MMLGGMNLFDSLCHTFTTMATGGFSTKNISIEHYRSPFLEYAITFFMFVGGCAGSTGGAIKCIRIYVLIKEAARELYRLIHPHAVAPVKLAEKVLPQETLNGIRALFFLYLGIFLLASLAVSLLGAGMITSISAVAATLGNVGPGLGAVGPADNFAHLPTASKWILTTCMLFGRLEIYTILVLLLPEFWKK